MFFLNDGRINFNLYAWGMYLHVTQCETIFSQIQIFSYPFKMYKIHWVNIQHLMMWSIWKKKNIIKYYITYVPVVHIIIKCCLKYNNITIIYLSYAIYFSTFKNTVFMFITCEFDFQNDFCLAISYHYFIFKTTYKLTNLNWLNFMCIIFSFDQYS